MEEAICTAVSRSVRLQYKMKGNTIIGRGDLYCSQPISTTAVQNEGKYNCRGVQLYCGGEYRTVRYKQQKILPASNSGGVIREGMESRILCHFRKSRPLEQRSETGFVYSLSGTLFQCAAFISKVSPLVQFLLLPLPRLSSGVR